MINVTVLFLNGGSPSTTVMPAEIFDTTGSLWNVLNAEEPSPRFRVTTATVDGRSVRAGETIAMTPQCALVDAPPPDLVFVPSGGLTYQEVFRDGYDIDGVVARNEAVLPWLRDWAASGIRIAGVCSGVALLATAGLLDGKRATTHWGVAKYYMEKFPTVDWQPEYLVTDAGNVCCGGGVNAASDLALYLVEKYCGREVACQSARAMLIEMPRTWQVAFAHLSPQTNHSDTPILNAQDWLHRHYTGEVSIEGLASMLGMSPRNFARRFKEATGKTPLNYLHTLRVETAKRLLENGRQSVQEIMLESGYEDGIFFRKLFKRHTGVSPAVYRARFGQALNTIAH
jgi:transcriptional regulator GlxA family with amidase domain